MTKRKFLLPKNMVRLFDYIEDPMNLALKLAKKCLEHDDVPVGCVILNNKNQLVGFGKNSVIKNKDATAHAEIEAIRLACLSLNSDKLFDTSLFVTLQPCVMCESAIFQSRINNIFFGAYQENSKEIHNYTKKKYFSEKHKFQFYGGFYEKQSSKLLKKFFEKKREKN